MSTDTLSPEAPSNDAYDLSLHDNLRTLSTNTVNNAEDIEGLLYIPQLPSSDPCVNVSEQYIPSSAPREADVPSQYYHLIAFIPWISQECTKSYLAAANDNALALITYIPNNQSDAPPPVNDQQWLLNDGGRWKSHSRYPVYAIPGTSGSAIMQQLSTYSGNVSSIRNGSFSSITSDQNDYIRLYTSIKTNASSNLPSLWAFLLMVLGIVLVLVGLTSSTMHYYQRRARRNLRRRVVEGEVDLEVLGIRRLTVPQDFLDKLPVYVYTTIEKKGAVEEAAFRTQLARRNSEPPATTHIDTTTDNIAAMPQKFQQPMCAICLDDFVPNSTIVKELPCRHIYHPECIDELLSGHSSLCPVCKGKVLPSGYCPETITNAMVRRERQARQLPQRRPDPQMPIIAAPVGQTSERQFAVDGRMASFHRQFGRRSHPGVERRISSAPEVQALEMINRPVIATVVNTRDSLAPPSPPQQPDDRAERARRRVSTLLGHQVTADEEEMEQRQRLPRC
ncbi:MAG: hypothetical protein Q9195_001736 [Heterodermia aff. obscurata]